MESANVYGSTNCIRVKFTNWEAATVLIINNDYYTYFLCKLNNEISNNEILITHRLISYDK